MKKTVALVTAAASLSALLSGSAFALSPKGLPGQDFAQAVQSEQSVGNVQNGQIQFSQSGQISFCEFVRQAVIVIAGEQPLLMDTHYAMSYMRKAQELGLIDEVPMEQWGIPAERSQMDEVLNRADETYRADIVSAVNSLLAASVTANGQAVDLKGSAPYVLYGKLMVPLRAVAESLGFTVLWDQENYEVFIDNGEVNTRLALWEDSYYKASSQAIGLTQAKPLGAPPVLKGDITYVPADLFALLYSDPQAVSVQDGVLAICEN